MVKSLLLCGSLNRSALQPNGNCSSSAPVARQLPAGGSETAAVLDSPVTAMDIASAVIRQPEIRAQWSGGQADF